MKFYKRLKVYKANNVTFDPETCRAYSYDWWQFVARINGAVVFNSYGFSNSTRKHQSKVRDLLNQLGIKINLYVRAPSGLQREYAGMEALKDAYQSQNFESARKIEQVFKVKMTQTEIQALYVAMEERLCKDFLLRSIRRQENNELKAFTEAARKLQNYLENDVCFRDYDIVHRKAFGDPENALACKAAVHQCIDLETMEADVENALYSFHRDGFGSIVFYVGGGK